MERCRLCRSPDLETMEYVETSFFGESVRVVVVFCPTCGNAETVSSHAVPVPVPV